MTYQGTIKRGVVVVSKATSLKDGTRVRVEPIRAPKKVASTAKKHTFHPVGQWQGEPGELEGLLARVQEARDADLELERNSWR
jgi:hypothetical protein